MARIVATPVLIFLALTDREDAYKWLLLAAFISDIVDGLIARSFSITSMLGSRLDTLADTLLWPAAIFGIWVFHPEVMTEHWLVIALVLGLWAIEMLVAWLRYVPVAVLAAMLFPALLVQDGQIDLGLNNLFLWAAFPTLLVAWKKQSLFGAVIVGMVVVAVARYVFAP